MIFFGPTGDWLPNNDAGAAAAKLRHRSTVAVLMDQDRDIFVVVSVLGKTSGRLYLYGRFSVLYCRALFQVVSMLNIVLLDL